MKFLATISLLLSTTLSLPIVRRDSLPFGLVVYRTDEPIVNGKIVNTHTDGTLWINSGTQAFLGIVKTNSTLQQYGSRKYLGIDGSSRALILKDLGYNDPDPKFAIDQESLEYDGTKMAIVCQKYNNEFQLYWQETSIFQCRDEEGKPSKGVNVNLVTVPMHQKRSGNSHVQFDTANVGEQLHTVRSLELGGDDDDNDENDSETHSITSAPLAKATTGAILKRKKRDLSVVLPMPYDIDLTVTMSPGSDGVATSLVLPDPTTTISTTTNSSVPTGHAPPVGAPPSNIHVEPTPIYMPAEVSPGPLSDNHVLSINMDIESNSTTINTIIANGTVDFGSREVRKSSIWPQLPPPVAARFREYSRLSPELRPVLHEAPEFEGKMVNTGLVEAKDGKHLAMTYALFDIPTGISGDNICYFEFESENPVFKPSMQGSSSFEIWEVDNSLDRTNITFNSQPLIKTLAADYSYGKFHSSSPIECNPGEPLSFVIKANQGHGYSKVTWWQHQDAGLKLVISHFM